MVFHQNVVGRKRKRNEEVTEDPMIEKSYRCQAYNSCKGRIYVKGDTCTKTIKPHTCERDRPDRHKVLEVSSPNKPENYTCCLSQHCNNPTPRTLKKFIYNEMIK